MTVKEAPPTVLRPPERKGHYIDLNSMYSFFLQKYHDHDRSARHAGKLFNHMINGTLFRKIDLEIRCRKCQKGFNSPSCNPRLARTATHTNEHDRREMEISIYSLARLDPTKFGGTINGVGPETVDDLRLLKQYL